MNYTKIASVIKYDATTGKLFWVEKEGQEAGSQHNAGYLRVKINQQSFLCHRVAWLLYYGSWPVTELDHIDGNRQNNKIENLRLANKRENAWNRLSKIGSTSLEKGVSWDKSRERCSAYIKIEGKVKNLGRFSCEQSAATTYNEFAKAHFGEFSNLNVIHPALSPEAII